MNIPVWCPNVKLFDYYKDLGINTVWMNEGTTPSSLPYDQYVAEARKRGFQVWSYPQQFCKNPGSTPAFPDRISLVDEPTLHGLDGEQLGKQLVAMQKVLNIPAVVNLEGQKFSRFAPLQSASQADKNAWADINNKQGAYAKLPLESVWFDFYIKNHPRYVVDAQGKVTKELKGWYELSNQFACIDFLLQYNNNVGMLVETSNQQIDINSRAPNRGEFRGQVIGALIWGARHWGIFPQRPPGAKSPLWEVAGMMDDATPSAIVEEIKVMTAFSREYGWLFELTSQRETADKFIKRLWTVNGNNYTLVLNTDSSQQGDYLGYEACMYKDGSIVWSAKEQSKTLPFAPAPVGNITITQAEYDGLKNQITDLRSAVDAMTKSRDTWKTSSDTFETLAADWQAKAVAAAGELQEVRNAIKTLLKGQE